MPSNFTVIFLGIMATCMLFLTATQKPDPPIESDPITIHQVDIYHKKLNAQLLYTLQKKEILTEAEVQTIISGGLQ